jgi:hypothetical protein
LEWLGLCGLAHPPLATALPAHPYPPTAQQLKFGNSSVVWDFMNLWSQKRVNEVIKSEILKGLSHEIFGPVYWSVLIHIGLTKNRFWFLNFKEAPSI